MAWRIIEESLLMPVRLANPLLDVYYPQGEVLMATVDTGFTGFLLVPPEIFTALKLNELKPTRSTGRFADGRSLRLTGALGMVMIPEIHFEDEGLIETSPEVKEILMGMRATEKLRLVIDGCEGTLTAEKC